VDALQYHYYAPLLDLLKQMDVVDDDFHGHDQKGSHYFRVCVCVCARALRVEVERAGERPRAAYPCAR
jgi:hypothetical protein